MAWFWNHADGSAEHLGDGACPDRSGALSRATCVAVALTALLWSWAGPARAEANISGMVSDAITGHPVTGASVVVRRSGDEVGSGATEADGVFQVFAEVPNVSTPQSLALAVARQGYADARLNVVIINGRPDQLSYRIPMLRSELADCDTSWTHTVVVGNVRPPASTGAVVLLSERVGEVLQYDLSTELQKTHLPASRQPVIVACPRIQPRTLTEHGGWVEALKTEALVVGAAEPVGAQFRVDLQVTTRHAPPGLPLLTSTPPMNLDRPASADLGRSALAPIMTALLRAYRDAGQFAECVEFANAAERILGENPDVAAMRGECQARLPNAGLLAGGGAP